MDIKTKYDIGDKVYAMHNNKVISFTIDEIEVIFYSKKPQSVRYCSKERYEEYSFSTGHNESYRWSKYEYDLFPTKEELLKSL